MTILKNVEAKYPRNKMCMCMCVTCKSRVTRSRSKGSQCHCHLKMLDQLIFADRGSDRQAMRPKTKCTQSFRAQTIHL